MHAGAAVDVRRVLAREHRDPHRRHASARVDRPPDGEDRAMARPPQDDDDWVGTPPAGARDGDRARPDFWRSQRPPALVPGLIGLAVIVVVLVVLLLG